MKREFLKNLGLEDEAIEKIISENGKDIEATKAKADKSQEIENLKNELNSNKQKLDEANVQIQKFKEMDVDSIKQEAENWKTKYSEFENQSKAEKEAFEKQLQEKEYEFAVKEYIGQHKFVNDWNKQNFTNELISKKFPLQDGKLLGVDDYVKDFQEKNQGVFAPIEEPKDPKFPQIVSPTNNQQTNTNDGFNFNFRTVRPVPKE